MAESADISRNSVSGSLNISFSSLTQSVVVDANILGGVGAGYVVLVLPPT